MLKCVKGGGSPKLTEGKMSMIFFPVIVPTSLYLVWGLPLQKFLQN